MIQSEGVPAGVVINPATPVSLLEDVLGLADYALVMSVNPGFGAQRFIPGALDKVRELDRRRKELGLDFHIEIDGGVTAENLPDVVHAGCDWVVTGNSVFNTPDAAAAVARLREIAQNATAVRV
jgi:ribulose-phosphate 3-epimerase